MVAPLLIAFALTLGQAPTTAPRAPATGEAPVAKGAAAADYDHRDLEIRFIGWSEASDQYAFVIQDRRYRQGALVDQRETTYVKKLVARARSEEIVIHEPVRQYLVRMGFARHEAEAEVVDPTTTRFPMGERRYYTFSLLPKEKLGWRFSLFEGEGAVVVQEGELEDVFPTVRPRLYLSPDGRKMVLLIKASAPYRTRDVLRLIRVM